MHQAFLALMAASASALVPDGHSFRVLTYNILARSLGSNTIPWVLNVSPQTKERIEASTGQPFHAWRRSHVDDEYKRHWHKNFHSGDYAAMRALWGGRVVKSDGDIPAKLKGLKFDEEDKVMYVKGGLPVVAITLRGVLRRALGETEGLRLFAEISEKDATIYDWAARGPKVFDVCTAGADVVTLAEYDVHSAKAAYAGPSMPFAESMARAGYDGAFFTDPLIGRTPPAGLGVFWRKETFELVEDTDTRVVECNSTSGTLSNHDLLETWHPLVVHGAAGVTAMELPAADRRQAAVARLRHKASGKTVCVVAVHLMTTSRDGPGVTRYPGEVRAGELATVKGIVGNIASKEDAVVLCGDFNTPPGDAHVWRGDVGVTHATGFTDGAFSWGARTLRDAFEDVHDWGDAAGVCTSKNGDRSLWIDYIFHDGSLAPVDRSDVSAPAGAIPDLVHPSDHLPLACTFRFV